jgi:2-iminobutanoate/2-iminopropanoate deaminase
MGKEARDMGRQLIILTKKAPEPIGPFSHGVRVDNLVFTQGHMGADPETGKLAQTSIAEETTRVLENVKATLEEAGSSLADVVKCTVFLTDLKDYGEMNAAYAEYFPTKRPARSCVQVVALANGARVEIEAIAVIS